MAQKTSVCALKGGVGKTDLLVQLAAALARKKKRVLVVDLDPQMNATRRLGITHDPSAPILTTVEIIQSGEEGVGKQAVVRCGWVDADGAPLPEAEYIDVLPSREDLTNRETESGHVGALFRLKKALRGWADDEYDVVLFDTPPSLGHLTQLALAASDDVLIPIEPNNDAVGGGFKTSQFVQAHAEDLANPGLHVSGVLVSKYNPNLLEHRFQYDGAKELFGDLLWNPARLVKVGSSEIQLPGWIPVRTRINEASGAGAPVSAYRDAPGREVTAIYDAIADLYIDKLLKGKAA